MTTPADVAMQMRLVLPNGDEPPLPLDLTGRRVYFGLKKKSWYRLREMRTNGGSYVVVGGFGNFSASKGGSWKVDVDWKGIGAEERENLQEQRVRVEAAARETREREMSLAAMSAAELWAAASREGNSPYLRRKMVEPEACRYLSDGSIVVPLLRYDKPREQALVGLQRIFGTGRKLFTSGFGKKGAAVKLGSFDDGDLVLVCEGYATGLTLRMAVQQSVAVVVALDAGNLLPVCELLRARWPGCRLLICADDDWRTAGNPGREKERQVVKTVDRCEFTWPVFPSDRGDKDTDFNDLHVLAGLRRVHGQVMGVIGALRRHRQAA